MTSLPQQSSSLDRIISASKQKVKLKKWINNKRNCILHKYNTAKIGLNRLMNNFPRRH